MEIHTLICHNHYRDMYYELSVSIHDKHNSE